jgi:hypothetical protein
MDGTLQIVNVLFTVCSLDIRMFTVCSPFVLCMFRLARLAKVKEKGPARKPAPCLVTVDAATIHGMNSPVDVFPSAGMLSRLFMPELVEPCRA